MTDEQKEQIAREYCRLRGLDPDEVVHLPNLDGRAVYHRTPRWRVMLRDVVQPHLDIKAAIDLVLTPQLPEAP